MASLQPMGSMLETSCGSPHYACPEVIRVSSSKQLIQHTSTYHQLSREKNTMVGKQTYGPVE